MDRRSDRLTIARVPRRAVENAARRAARPAALVAALCAVAIAALGGCDGGSAPGCVPGQTSHCECDAATTGSRRCDDDGRYGACTCGDLSGAGGGAVDDLPDAFAAIGRWCGAADRYDTWLVVTPRQTACEDQAELVGGLGDRDGLSLRIDGTEAIARETRFDTVARRCRRGTCEDYPAEVTLTDLDEGRGADGFYRLVLADGRRDEGRFEARWCTWEQWVESPPPNQLVRGLRIDDVAFYQGVKVPLVEAGQPIVRPNAPVIAGRPGVLRVAVGADDDWAQRDFRVRLSLLQPDGTEVEIEIGADDVTERDEADPDSTFNFELSADDVRRGTQYVVEVLETEPCFEAGGSDEAARWPRNGRDALPARETGELAVTIVPVSYTAGGSPAPSFSPGWLATLQQEVAAQFPVTEVRLRVREPVAFDGVIEPSCDDLLVCGWNDLLAALVDLRVDDGAPPDEYYYGMVMPGADLDSYCGISCILGLGAVTGPGDEMLRVATGVGFQTAGADRLTTLDTIVHELGHALGRAHSPCGNPASIDPNFPYPAGDSGSWGYDRRDGSYRDPREHGDIMGYCPPAWISDYTFDGIAQRLLAIGAQEVPLSASDHDVQAFVRGRGGRTRFLRPAPATAMGAMARGEGMAAATVIDATGAEVAVTQVRGLPLPDTGGTFWVMPRPQPSWASLRLPDGEEVDLRDRVDTPRLRPLPGR